MDSNLIPAKDERVFSEFCKASVTANGKLMALMLEDLPADKVASLDGFLTGGGSIGIETLVDGKGRSRINLIAVEREGMRLVLSTVTTSAKP